MDDASVDYWRGVKARFERLGPEDTWPPAPAFKRLSNLEPVAFSDDGTRALIVASGSLLMLSTADLTSHVLKHQEDARDIWLAYDASCALQRKGWDDEFFLHVIDAKGALSTTTIVLDDADSIETIAFHPSTKILALVTSYDGSVRLIDTESSEVIQNIDLGHGAEQLFFSPDGRHLFVVDDRESTIIGPEGVRESIDGTLALSPDGRMLAYCRAQHLMLGEVSTLTPLTWRSEARRHLLSDLIPVSPIAEEHYGPLRDEWLETYHGVLPENLKVDLDEKMKPDMEWLRFSPDGRRLLMASRDHVAILNINTGQAHGPLPVPHGGGAIESANVGGFSPDSQRVFLGRYLNPPASPDRNEGLAIYTAEGAPLGSVLGVSNDDGLTFPLGISVEGIYGFLPCETRLKPAARVPDGPLHKPEAVLACLCAMPSTLSAEDDARRADLRARMDYVGSLRADKTLDVESDVRRFLERSASAPHLLPWALHQAQAGRRARANFGSADDTPLSPRALVKALDEAIDAPADLQALYFDDMLDTLRHALKAKEAEAKAAEEQARARQERYAKARRDEKIKFLVPLLIFTGLMVMMFALVFGLL